MKKRLILLMMLLPAVLFSNPLPLGGPGRTVVPYISKSGSIRLKEEHISIKVGDTQEVPGFALKSKMKIKCVSFNCTYYLHNSGAPQTINIGFPFYSGRTSAGEGYGEIDDFKVYLDDVQLESIKEQHRAMKEVIIFKDKITGTIEDKLVVMLLKKKYISEIAGQPGMYDFSPMGYTVKTIRKNLDRIQYNKKQKALLLDIIKNQIVKGDFSFEMYRNWYYFPVMFKANATHKLVITYRSSNGNFQDRSFYYVLTSARLWNGAIDRCVVDIDFLDKNIDRFSIQPKTFTFTGTNTIHFEWNNFIPYEDIFVRFMDADN